MPRYFLHLYNDVIACDPEGIELPDDEAARQAAVQSARDMACESVRKGKLVLQHRIDVVNDAGVVIDSVHFGDAVRIEREDASA